MSDRLAQLKRLKLLALANWLEREHEEFEFDMTVWQSAPVKTWVHMTLNESVCGTRGCIAGAVWVMAGSPKVNKISKFAIDYLGLSTEEAYLLFRPFDASCFAGTTSKEAACVVRHFAQTGEIDWRHRS